MAKYDPKKNHWDKIFLPKEPLPVLPEELTKAWWDKKKSLVAKLTKATGVGAALQKVESTFKVVKFQEFTPHVTKVKETTADFVKFMQSGEIKAFHTALKECRDVAKTQVEECKKNPLISKDTRTALEDIVDNADKLMVAVNANSLGGYLDKAIQLFEKNQKAKALAGATTSVKLAKEVIAKLPTKIGELRKANSATAPLKPEAQAKLGSDIFTLSRDMTQGLLNLGKIAKAGGALPGFDAAKAETLGKSLVAYSNLQDNGAGLVKGKDAKAIATIIDSVDRWGKEYAAIVGAVKTS